MWGIIPAAGFGSRLQPLAFSKELLPVGTRFDGAVERPRAISEYLLERMALAGVSKICFVISPDKSDILSYYGARVGEVDVFYVVQPRPAGLCDAIFRAAPLVADEEQALVGLPDTIWFPEDACRALGSGELSFLLFPVAHPEAFDAVVTDPAGRVVEIQVKRKQHSTHWIWGAFSARGRVLRELYELWRSTDQRPEYFGDLVNRYLEQGGSAQAVYEGQAYVDVGTVHGYREAIRLLEQLGPARDSRVRPLAGNVETSAPLV